MINGCVELSLMVCDGLYLALHQDFNCVEQPERMAWVSLILKMIPDNDKYFPRGKWATIQAIDSQLHDIANDEIILQDTVRANAAKEEIKASRWPRKP